MYACVWPTEFTNVEGNNHCIALGSFGIIPFVALDTAISGACLTILAAPTVCGSVDKAIRTAV